MFLSFGETFLVLRDALQMLVAGSSELEGLAKLPELEGIEKTNEELSSLLSSDVVPLCELINPHDLSCFETEKWSGRLVLGSLEMGYQLKSLVLSRTHSLSCLVLHHSNLAVLCDGTIFSDFSAEE